jgi:hypothetical protein
MPGTLSQANAALIQDYLRIATVTDDMDRFSQLIAEDCVWVMMPTGHAFRGFEQVSALAKTAGGTRTHDEAHRVTSSTGLRKATIFVSSTNMVP